MLFEAAQSGATKLCLLLPASIAVCPIPACLTPQPQDRAADTSRGIAAPSECSDNLTAGCWKLLPPHLAVTECTWQPGTELHMQYCGALGSWLCCSYCYKTTEGHGTSSSCLLARKASATCGYLWAEKLNVSALHYVLWHVHHATSGCVKMDHITWCSVTWCQAAEVASSRHTDGEQKKRIKNSYWAMEGTRIFIIACESGGSSTHRNAALTEHPFRPAHLLSLWSQELKFTKDGREKIFISFTLR